MPARFRLRPFGRADFDQLIADGGSPEFLFQWAGPLFTHPLDRAQLERYLLTGLGNPPSSLLFTALDQAGAPVGHIELTRIDRRNLCATVARVLVYAGHRGQGIGREMLTQALRVGFDDLGLHRVELLVFDFNQPAIRAYEHAGMKIEGLLRDVRKVGDGYWSVYQMSILEAEWRGHAHANQ
jgi:RimJ/RimL family protein N-acetyltransferase